MYMTAAYIVEKITGLPYPFNVNILFEKLGMQRATFSPLEASLSGFLAQGFYPVATNVSREDGGEGWLGNKYRVIPYFINDTSVDMNAGAGGVLASADDMVCLLVQISCK